MKRPLLYLGIVLLVITVGGANYLVLTDLTDISTTPPTPPASSSSLGDLGGRPIVKIGVISRFAPNVTYAGYQPIMDYLNRLGTHHYQLQLSTSYQDAVDRLREGRVDASFLGAWIYGHLGSGDDLSPIAAPLNSQGRSDFKAVLVARAASELTGVSQLGGLKVALPSAQSWSGNWLQTNGLKDAGLAVADLDSIHHFDHHHTVVWQVLRGNFDAGVVKESVAAEYASEGLKTVAYSQPIPGPPLVGRSEIEPGILEEISRLLLLLDPQRPKDQLVLDSWTQEFSYGFTPVGRDHYQTAFRGQGAE